MTFLTAPVSVPVPTAAKPTPYKPLVDSLTVGGPAMAVYLALEDESAERYHLNLVTRTTRPDATIRKRLDVAGDDAPDGATHLMTVWAVTPRKAPSTE